MISPGDTSLSICLELNELDWSMKETIMSKVLAHFKIPCYTLT